MKIRTIHSIMYPFIICFCGRSLGDIYDAFKVMRAAAYAQAYEKLDDKIDPNTILFTGSLEIDLSDAFKQLNITMDCCRVRLCTQVEFKEHY